MNAPIFSPQSCDCQSMSMVLYTSDKLWLLMSSTSFFENPTKCKKQSRAIYENELSTLH